MAITQFYGGSLMLTPVANFMGITLDYVNFIFCCVLVIAVGQFQRKFLVPTLEFKNTRMALEILISILLCIFCFGQQVIYLLLQSTVALLIMKIFSRRHACALVFLWSMGFIVVAHAYRQHFDYGGYTLDITGPIMIQTQKLTSLAFNLYDGERIVKGEPVRDILRRHAVLHFPSLLQFYAYTLYYHGVMAGPFVFYTEYMDYINCYGLKELPTASKQISICLAWTVVHGILSGYIYPHFPTTVFATAEFQKFPMTRKLLYSTFSLFLARQKYYFAWTISEAGCMSAGLGFSGFDKNGVAQWETTKNADLKMVEGGSSLKVIIDNWNIKTANWLREVIYERCPVSCRLFLSFFCSALWHGLYPGYYMMFLSFALFTATARIVRRNARPYFQHSPITSMAYDILTTVVSNMIMNYSHCPFHLLELESGLLFWKAFYFFPHSVAIFIIFCSLLRENDRFNLKRVQFRPIADLIK